MSNTIFFTSLERGEPITGVLLLVGNTCTSFLAGRLGPMIQALYMYLGFCGSGTFYKDMYMWNLPFVALVTTWTLIPMRQSTSPKKFTVVILSPANSVARDKVQIS